MTAGENAATKGLFGKGYVASKKRRAKYNPPPPWHRELAALIADACTVTEAASRLGRPRQSCSRVMAGPRFKALLASATSTARAAAERELALARPGAVRALRAVCDDAGAPAAERRAAAVALLAAGQPPSERQRAEARRAVIASLPVDLRRRAADALDGAERAEFEAMTDEELEAFVAERS